MFTSVLLDTGRLADFLQEAVAVISQAAADEIVAAREATYGVFAGEAGIRPSWRGGGGVDAANWEGFGESDSSTSRPLSRPEPLLSALCSLCLEHSPARSIFVQALLTGPGSWPDSRSTRPGGATVRTPGSGSSSANEGGRHRNGAGLAASSASSAIDPCVALFILCLHPHPPTAAAASTLLQCLLVGGGALGAVSGPSPGTAAGVGVIPAGYYCHPAVGVGSGGGGIGREDPLQAALLERIGVVVLSRARRDGGVSGGGGGAERRSTVPGDAEADTRSVGAGREGGEGDSSAASSGSDLDDVFSDGDPDWFHNVRPDASGGFATASSSAACGAAAYPAVPTASASPTTFHGSLGLLLRRVEQIGTELASAHAKEQLGVAGGEVVVAGAARGKKRVMFARAEVSLSSSPSSCPRALGESESFVKARSVEVEQELTSLLCLLSSLVSEVPFFLTSAL